MRTVLDRCFDCLVRWLAPVICFTAEEAWLARHGDMPERSIHLELFADVPASWRDDALGERWAVLRELRRVVTGALELERGQSGWDRVCRPLSSFSSPKGRPINFATSIWPSSASLRRRPVRSGPAPEDAFTLPDVAEVGVRISPAPGERCERCWRVLPEVGRVPGHADLCRRCAEVVDRAGLEPVAANG